VRQLAEADDEYYSVPALKSEFKDKTPTPPSKETEQSIIYKKLNERINQLKIAISRNQNTYNNAGFRNNNQGLCFHCNSEDHMIKNCPMRQGKFNRTNSQFRGNNPQAKLQGKKLQDVNIGGQKLTEMGITGPTNEIYISKLQIIKLLTGLVK